MDEFREKGWSFLDLYAALRLLNGKENIAFGLEGERHLFTEAQRLTKPFIKSILFRRVSNTEIGLPPSLRDLKTLEWDRKYFG